MCLFDIDVDEYPVQPSPAESIHQFDSIQVDSSLYILCCVFLSCLVLSCPGSDGDGDGDGDHGNANANPNE